MRTTTAERGVAIIVVLLSMALLAVVALGITTMGSGNLLHAYGETENRNALLAAEGAAWIKVGQILATGDTTDVNFPAMDPAVALPNGVVYGVEVFTSNPTSNGFIMPPAGGGTSYYILATGQTPNGRRRQFAMLGTVITTWWDMPAFAGSSIKLEQQAATRTYNSSLGPPPAMGGPAHPDNSKAHIGTNEFVDSIEIKNFSKVGDEGVGAATAKVFGPPGSTESVVVDKGSSPLNYAGFATLGSPKPMPDWAELGPPALGTTTYDNANYAATFPGAGTVPGFGLLPASYADVDLTGLGNDLVLDVSGAAGTTVEYRFDNVTLSSDSQLRLHGYDSGNPVKVKIFVTNLTLTDGSVVNPDTRPRVLQFFAENDIRMKEKSTRAFYVAYAVRDVIVDGKMTGAPLQLYGSVVAKRNIKVEKKAELWYDEDLLTDDTGTRTFVVQSLQSY